MENEFFVSLEHEMTRQHYISFPAAVRDDGAEIVKLYPEGPGKALNYLKEQWPYLTNYLKDGRPELSNNRAERSMKPFVIDRKNFLFANTPRGATGSAGVFSIIQTALENGLDPYRYLIWLMKAANKTDLSKEENLQALLPWNAPQDCRAG